MKDDDIVYGLLENDNSSLVLINSFSRNRLGKYQPHVLNYLIENYVHIGLHIHSVILIILYKRGVN